MGRDSRIASSKPVLSLIAWGRPRRAKDAFEPLVDPESADKLGAVHVALFLEPALRSLAVELIKSARVDVK